jgi:hypothetical protein
LIVLVLAYGHAYSWLFLILLIGAVLLLGGCPSCWLTGLFETIRSQRDSGAGPVN